MYLIFPGNGEWNWQLKAGDGRVVAQGEGYRTKESCQRALATFWELAKDPKVTDLDRDNTDSQGQPSIIDITTYLKS